MISVMGGALYAGGAAHAQSQSATLAPQLNIDEIIVTATKRDTTLQTTPVAISVLSGAQLDFLNSRDFEDYFRRVPGLAVVDNGGGRKRYLLRGVSTISANGTQATVAQYMDEVPLTDNFDQQPDPRLIDIERIEVLRGPQGTLFGARAVAGTIRTITRKPVMDRVEGSATVTLSDTHFGGLNSNLEGVLNAPLGGNVAVRTAVFYSHDEGYVDNIFAGGTFRATANQLPPGVPIPPPVVIAPIAEKNYNDVTYYGGRMAVRWQPSDALTVDLMGLAQQGKIGGSPYFDVGATGDESKGLIVSVVGDTGNSDKLYIGSATATYNFDWATLTSVAAYSERDNLALNAAAATGPAVTPGGPGSTMSSGANTGGWTLETRLASKTEGPWQWIVGGYGFFQTRHAHDRMFIAYGSVIMQESVNRGSTQEAAGFGELSYKPIDKLTLTAGVRYSDYDNTLHRIFIVPPPNSGLKPGPDPTTPSYSEDSLTSKFEISYQATPDAMVYALASEGFRPGGFNGNASTGTIFVPATFKSDSLWNYELGAKTSWLDHRVSLDGALYRIDWKNMQLQGFTPGPNGNPNMPIIYTTNSSASRIVGLELEATARLSQAWSVDASFNHFFKASLTKDSPVNPNGLAPKAGDPLSFNPETSALLGAEYRRPLGQGLSGFVRAEWSYVGQRFTGFRPFLNTGAVNTIYNHLPAYQLFNARLGVNTRDWRATLFVDNLSDARPIMQQQNYPGSITTRVTAKPRTFGATITRTF